MKNDKGMTLVLLVITVVLMCILMTFLVNVGSFNDLLQVKNRVEEDFNDVITNTDEKVNSIRDQWGDII